MNLDASFVVAIFTLIATILAALFAPQQFQAAIRRVINAIKIAIKQPDQYIITWAYLGSIAIAFSLFGMLVNSNAGSLATALLIILLLFGGISTLTSNRLQDYRKDLLSEKEEAMQILQAKVSQLEAERLEEVRQLEVRQSGEVKQIEDLLQDARSNLRYIHGVHKEPYNIILYDVTYTLGVDGDESVTNTREIVEFVVAGRMVYFYNFEVGGNFDTSGRTNIVEKINLMVHSVSDVGREQLRVIPVHVSATMCKFAAVLKAPCKTGELVRLEIEHDVRNIFYPLLHNHEDAGRLNLASENGKINKLKIEIILPTTLCYKHPPSMKPKLEGVEWLIDNSSLRAAARLIAEDVKAKVYDYDIYVEERAR